MDATQGSEASKSLLGPLNGKFSFKKNEDGTIIKNVVICSICKKEFSYHRSSSSLTYHLNAKHVRTSSTVTGASANGSSLRQTTLTETGKRMSKATTEKLTNAIAKWIAADCRPISIVEDEGLQEAFQIAPLGRVHVCCYYAAFVWLATQVGSGLRVIQWAKFKNFDAHN